MNEIVVTRSSDRQAWGFEVRVSEGGSSTEHQVTVSQADLGRLSAERAPEEFIRACFEFLLEREPKESILRSFDVSVIGRYFPEFEREIVSRP